MPHAIAVTSMTVFTKSNLVKNVQYHSFHGNAFRDKSSKRWSRLPYDAEPALPLCIVRDGNRIPDICSPALELIISSKVKGELSGCPNVKFVEVHFDKLVDFFFEKGDFRILQNDDRIDPLEMLMNKPSVPDFNANAGRFFELVVPRHVDIVSRFPGGTEIHFSRRGKIGDIESPIVTLSEDLVTAFPIQWYEGWHIFDPQVFSRIERWFDFDFFLKQRLDF